MVQAGARAERAQRIAALAFDYAAQPAGAVDRCNLCGATRFVTLTHRDRYGYPARAVACAACGLVFLSPRMTAEAYADFYVRTYRPLVSAFHGRVIDARTIQAEQRVYAEERGDFLAPFLEGRGARTLLDVGGSTGVVAHALAARFGLEATLIDPAPLEIAEARRLGLETIAGLVEAHDFGDRRFDVVVLCQTIDHLLDASGTLGRLRDILAPGGLFFVDIVDFRAACLRAWSVEAAVKVDHPYAFIEPVMAALLARTGFDVLRMEYAADHLHVGYVCRPVAPVRDALPAPSAVDAFLRELRYVQNAPRPGRE